MKLAINFLLAFALLLGPGRFAPGQEQMEKADVPGAGEEELNRILKKIVTNQALSDMELSRLNGYLVRVEADYPRLSGTESRTLESEKKVYMLKVERNDAVIARLLEMQKSLLQSQLMIMKVLEVIAQHQAKLERRVARSENANREVIMGMKDIGLGLDFARLDVSGTSSGQDEISGMCLTISEDLKKVMEVTE